VSRSRTGHLPPFPEGWYFIASRARLLRERLVEKTWMGQEIVAWLDDQSRICVADAICPHMGSHMGPSVGGLVKDGCLVCPFHGFEFDSAGQCVATPNAPPPKAAKLKMYQGTEIAGLIFAWWGDDGRPPRWHLPEDPASGNDWSAIRLHTLRFRGHPQETAENAVDLGHLRYVHGYGGILPGELTISGPHLRSAFRFRRSGRILGRSFVHEVAITAHVHGWGYSLVALHEESIDMHARLWVLATPVDGEQLEMTLVSQARRIDKPRRFFSGLGFLPAGVRHRLMNRFLLLQQIKDVQQDVVIWERKRYQSPPRLCRADGPIGKYRRYCRQFYRHAAGDLP